MVGGTPAALLAGGSPHSISILHVAIAIMAHHRHQAEAAAVRAGSYNRPRLIRLTYEYARSDESRDLLLQSFFQPLGLSLSTEEDITFGE